MIGASGSPPEAASWARSESGTLPASSRRSRGLERHHQRPGLFPFRRLARSRPLPGPWALAGRPRGRRRRRRT